MMSLLPKQGNESKLSIDSPRFSVKMVAELSLFVHEGLARLVPSTQSDQKSQLVPRTVDIKNQVPAQCI